MKDQSKTAAKEKLKKEADLLNEVSQKIWENPELKFEEFKAHDLLCDVLEKQNFKVQRKYILPTAFRAEYSGKKPGPVVSIMCEYDALPEVGHACGHNLIAEAGLGAGLALKAALEADPSLPGKVVILGTPAEEGGGGKIKLIKAGAFKDIDIALMVHPSPHNYLYTPFIGNYEIKVTYTGKEAHASGYPWEGINALDAAVSCYNSLSVFRQQMKPNWKVHAIITHGGVAVNVIPALSKMTIQYRAPSTKDMTTLKKRIVDCVNSAAMATGCQVDIQPAEREVYDSLITNKVLIELYQKYSEERGIKFEDGNPKVIPFVASSDMGNVSHVVPSIHPCIYIGTKAPNHSVDFTDASGKPEAQQPTLIAAEAMALLAIDVMENPKILEATKKQFKEDIVNDAA